MGFTYLPVAAEAFLLCRLYKNMLTYKYSNRHCIGAGIFTFLFLMIRYYMYFLWDNMIYIGALQLIGSTSMFITACLFFKDNLKRKLLISFLYFMIIGVSELIVIIILILITKKEVHEITENIAIARTATVMSKLISLYIIEQVIYRFRNLKSVSFSYTKELTLILIMNMLLFITSLYFITDPSILEGNIYRILLFITISVVFISLLACYLIIKIAKKSKIELEYQLQLQQIEMESQMNKDMSSMIQKLRSLRHDMNNHIGIMSGLLQTMQYDELKNYLNDMCEDINLTNDYIFLENTALTVLLNNKLNKAHTNHIDLQLLIQSETLPIADKDMCTLIGNVLDNAIEATTKVETPKEISFQLLKKGSQYLLSCENPFSEKPVRRDGKFLTSKANKTIHGIGIRNIQSIVDKYNGICDISYDNSFLITIMFDEVVINRLEGDHHNEH